MDMKKFYTSLMALATLAMAFSSCTKEVDTQKGEKATGEMKTITVQTGIGTRTTLDSNHENIIWSAGDKLSIFNDVDNANYEADYVAGGDLTVEVPAATEEIYAHYPYYDGNTKGPSEVSIFISNNQTQKNPGELDGFYYPMVAKGTVTADNKAIISLYPVASALALNIYHTGLSGEEKVKNVKVTPAAANTKFTGSQKTNLTGDSIKYTEAGSSNPITVTLTNPLTLGNSKPADKQTFAGQIYVCLAKQSYANVKFEIETTKGVYTITSSDTPFDCVNNDFVPVNINLNKASFAGMTTVDTENADYTTGFESTEGFASGSTYNNQNLAYFGPQDGARWDTYYGTVSTNDKLAGSQSMQMRWYTSAPGNLGYAETYFYVTKINCVSFKAAATNGLKIGLYYKTASADEWTLAQTYQPSAEAAEYAYYPASVIENAQIRFGIILPDTAPSSTSNIRIDDVVISKTATVYSISVASDITHGSVAASATSARAGSTITLTVTPDADYILDRLTVKTVGGLDVNLTTVTENTVYSFEMPASNVTVSARFKSAGGTTWTLVKSVGELTNGMEIVIADKDHEYAMGAQNTNNRAGVAVTADGDDLTITSEVQIITLEAEGNNWMLNVGENQYLYAAGSSNNYLKTSSSSTVGNNGVFAISISSNIASIIAQGDNSRKDMRFNPNNGSPIFTCYASSSAMAKLAIYKLADNKPSAPISWSAAEATATLLTTTSMEFNAPVLSNDQNLPVTYESSDPSVATVDSDGTVTPLAAGTTTIKAIFSGDDTYKATTVNYTLTVVDNIPVVAAPTFSPAPGQIELGTHVTISCATPGAMIYYTLDGVTNPTSSSIPFIGDGAYIEVNAPIIVIKAIAVKAGYKDSEVVTAVFTTGGPAPETITFSEKGYTNQQEVSTVEGTNMTITFDKGTNSNVPKYYTSGEAIRAYGGNYFTVAAKQNHKISKIELSFASGEGSNAITTDVVTYSNGTWEGSASSVKFTIGGTSGHRRIAAIKVTYSK